MEHVCARLAAAARRAQQQRRRRLRLRLAEPPYGLLLVLVRVRPAACRVVGRRRQLRLRLDDLVPGAVVGARRGDRGAGSPTAGDLVEVDEAALGVRRVDERGQVGVVEHQVVEEGQRVAAHHATPDGVRRCHLPSLGRQVFVEHLADSPFVLHATQTQDNTAR